MDIPQKLDLKTMSISDDKKAKLKELFPEVFTEDKIDFDKLKLTLGEEIDISDERFGLTWAGKSDCFKVIQEPSIATLKPCREESVNWDTTENLFIEGDNREVLKQLQKAYYGKVKMIYIDPPYNTGNEFIYPDKYQENLDTYLAYTGQVDEEGKKFSTNSETTGRFHSNWLNMIYPRLFTARNLLRNDGVIYISIDDNEIDNLRKICNEVFGENCFLGCFIWKKKTNGNNMGNIPPVHDYILAYAKKFDDNLILGLPLSNEAIEKRYSNPDNDPNGLWTTSDLSANHMGPYFKITNPVTGEEFYPPKGRYWVFNEEEVNKRIIDGRIIFGRDGRSRPIQKKYLSERKSNRIKIDSLIDNVLNSDGTKEIAELLEPKIFTHPKPSRLIKRLMQASSDNQNDIILDFFAGSCSTAQATIELNIEDGGNRKFIMVQLPEPTEEKSEAYKAGYKTIADIGKERIRRVIKNIQKEQEAERKKKAGEIQFEIEEPKEIDLGFKVFKLDRSNFKIWDGDVEKKPIEEQLQLNIHRIDPNSSEEDLLYEILLKSGF